MEQTKFDPFKTKRQGSLPSIRHLHDNVGMNCSVDGHIISGSVGHIKEKCRIWRAGFPTV